MRRRPRSKANPRKQATARRAFTAADVRLMLSNPVYAYGTFGLQPAERVAEEVMRFNAQLAHAVREIGVTFTVADLDQRFQALLQHLEDAGTYQRDIETFYNPKRFHATLGFLSSVDFELQSY
jgi:hypothetical protein